MLTNFIKSISFIICCFISSNCFAGLKDYPKIGVLEFNNLASESYDISLEDTSMVSDYMLEELIDTGRFEVIELEQLQAIFDEHNLNIAGVVDPKTAVKIGKLTGLQYLIYGNVTGLSSKESGVSCNVIKNIGVENKQYIVSATITARIVDLKTGRIVLSAKGTDTSTSTKTEVAYRAGHRFYPQEGHFIRIGSDQISQIQVHNALIKAVYNAVNGKDGFITKIEGKTNKKV